MRKWGLAMMLLTGAGLSHADSTIDPSHPYAYGANIGWINALADTNHGAVIGLSYCTGFLYSANAGWIGLGGGPANGWQYSNAAADDWGINHDGEGRLSGRAYGANVGWVTFEQTYGRPRADLRTGNLSGSAYGANIGWISLSNAQAFVRTSRLDTGPDTDLDGNPDAWEYRYTNTLAYLGARPADADEDGAPDEEEYAADTDPTDDGDVFEMLSLARAGRTNFVEFTTRPTRLYRLEQAAAATGAWTDVFGILLGPPASSPSEVGVTGVVDAAQSYRVKAVMPLSGE